MKTLYADNTYLTEYATFKTNKEKLDLIYALCRRSGVVDSYEIIKIIEDR